jgi:hypothetical protein
VLVALLLVLAGCSSPDGSDTAEPTDTDGELTTVEPTETDDTTDEETTEEETTETDDTADNESESISGRMLVVIEGRDTHLETDSDADFSFNETDEHTWTAEKPMSIAGALETAGVTAEADSLTIDGETYSESDESTTITYRVDGTEIDEPSEYELEDLNPPTRSWSRSTPTNGRRPAVSSTSPTPTRTADST